MEKDKVVEVVLEEKMAVDLVVLPVVEVEGRLVDVLEQVVEVVVRLEFIV